MTYVVNENCIKCKYMDCIEVCPVEWARMNKEMFASTPAGRPAGIYFMRSAWLHSQPEVQVMWAGDQQTDFSDGDGFPSVIPTGW